jgi:sec-independent protein translocase protein TatC
MKNKKENEKKETNNHPREMSFLEHIRELRKRLIVSIIAWIVCSIISYLFFDIIISVLYKPFETIHSSFNDSNLYVTSLFEGFLIRFKISLISGIIVSLPVHLYNSIKFIFPGLKKKEKKVIVISLLSSFLLIGASIYYTYFQIIPFSIEFLMGNNFIPRNTGILLNYGENIFYIFQFLLVSLLLFQVPILLELLMIMNLVQRKTLFRASRVVIVLILVLAAFLTPPDVGTQVAIALPLIVLYFLTILIAKIFRFGEGDKTGTSGLNEKNG